MDTFFKVNLLDNSTFYKKLIFKSKNKHNLNTLLNKLHDYSINLDTNNFSIFIQKLNDNYSEIIPFFTDFIIKYFIFNNLLNIKHLKFIIQINNIINIKYKFTPFIKWINENFTINDDILDILKYSSSSDLSLEHICEIFQVYSLDNFNHKYFSDLLFKLFNIIDYNQKINLLSLIRQYDINKKIILLFLNDIIQNLNFINDKSLFSYKNKAFQNEIMKYIHFLKFNEDLDIYLDILYNIYINNFSIIKKFNFDFNELIIYYINQYKDSKKNIFIIINFIKKLIKFKKDSFSSTFLHNVFLLIIKFDIYNVCDININKIQVNSNNINQFFYNNWDFIQYYLLLFNNKNKSLFILNKLNKKFKFNFNNFMKEQLHNILKICKLNPNSDFIKYISHIHNNNAFLYKYKEIIINQNNFLDIFNYTKGNRDNINYFSYLDSKIKNDQFKIKNFIQNFKLCIKENDYLIKQISQNNSNYYLNNSKSMDYIIDKYYNYN